VYAHVVHVEPGVGFGARFLDDNDEARDVVAQFIQRFRKAEGTTE
jgi:hypothetical protein